MAIAYDETVLLALLPGLCGFDMLTTALGIVWLGNCRMHRPFPAALFALIGLCLLWLFPTSPAAQLSAQTDARQRVIELTNQIRVANNLPPLKRNDTLQAAADWIVQDNASRDTPSHTDALGRNIGARLTDFGYAYSIAAENLAAGYFSPEAVLDGWMNSTGHRANILRDNICEIGAGYIYQSGTMYGHFWSQNFGCRWNTYPVVINNEAASTTSREVTLYMYGTGWAEQMRLSNDGHAWTDWMPYTATISWTLLPGTGERAVFAEVRRGATVYQSSDSIFLNDLSAASHRYFVPLIIR